MTDRYPCAHCSTSGTCKTANDGKSCAACVRKNGLQADNYGGSACNDAIVCSVCRGIGSVEPVSLGFQKHFTSSLALVFVGLAFTIIIIFGVMGDQFIHFETVLAFAGTLIGSITGFYFGGARRSNHDSRGETMELPTAETYDAKNG